MTKNTQNIQTGPKTNYTVRTYEKLYIVKKNNWRVHFFTSLEELEAYYPNLVGKVTIRI